MRSIEVKTIPVQKLHRHLESGRFAVPRLQREFVWNGKKAAALLDSIHRRMPVGSLLIWKTGRSNESLLRKAMHILPPFDRSNAHIWFLIDGQQRLSVLHQCFSSGDPKFNADDNEVDFSKVTFAVNGSADDGSLFAYRTPIDGEFVSVRTILARNWKQRLEAKLPEYKMQRIKKCRDAILSYRVPVIFTQTADVDEVKELFIRINSMGTPIRAADRAFTDISEIDLRGMAHELRDQLQEGGFRRLPPETVLQGFALALDPKSQDVGERAYRSTLRAWEKRAVADGSSKKEAYNLWDRYKRACGLAVNYLQVTFNLRDAEFLPSTNMLATFAVFFFHHPSQPSSAQRREICKWFWATGVGKRYSGRGYRENIVLDAAFFRRLARGHGRFPLANRIPRSEIRAAQYGQRSSVTNAFYCLLANRGPCYFKNGEPLPMELYAVRANRKNRHHIFPQTLASNSGLVPSQYNSVCNLCFLDEQTNQEIGAKSPRAYLETWRRRKFFARAMKSHLVPYDSTSALWERGVKRAYPRFVKQRLALLCREFEKQAGIKLFQQE